MAEEKTQIEINREQQEAERKRRSAERKAKKVAGEAALGGQTLSEALRGATSTRERKEIFPGYEKVVQDRNQMTVDDGWKEQDELQNDEEDTQIVKCIQMSERIV